MIVTYKILHDFTRFDNSTWFRMAVQEGTRLTRLSVDLPVMAFVATSSPIEMWTFGTAVFTTGIHLTFC